MLLRGAERAAAAAEPAPGRKAAAARAAAVQLLTRRTLKDAWNPILAAASRGSLETLVFLVDTSRAVLRGSQHRKLLASRDARGHTAAALARKRSHAKCAAYLEWNLEVKGTALGLKRGESASHDGRELFIANKGRWADEVDGCEGLRAVTPLDCTGFKTDFTPRGKISHLHDATTAFGRGPASERRTPRRVGGICTTFHLNDVIDDDDDDDEEEEEEDEGGYYNGGRSRGGRRRRPKVGERDSGVALKGAVSASGGDASGAMHSTHLPKSHPMSQAQRGVTAATVFMQSGDLERASYE